MVAFKKAIIAAGSQAVRLPFMPDDPRVVDSTGALALQGVPQKMLIVGGGIIGLEMGTVYSTLGARLDVVEMMDGLMQGADRDLVKVWEKMNKHRFDNILLKTKTVGAQATPEGIKVQFEGLDGTKSEGIYDLVLQAALSKLKSRQFDSRPAIFETFRKLHPKLKDDFFLKTEEEEDDPYESSQMTVLIANPHGIFAVYSMREVYEFNQFWAIGSGRDYAVGAMWAAWPQLEGAAEIAQLGVQAGCEFDVGTSLPMTLFTTRLAAE